MANNLEDHNELTKSDFLNEHLDKDSFARDALKFELAKDKVRKDQANIKKTLDEIRKLELPTIGGDDVER